MINKPARSVARKKRHQRVRNHISGTANRPRLAVFRSNKHIYAQVIDDDAGVTLVAASTKEKPLSEQLEKTSDVSAAVVVGKTIGEKAIAKGINEVIFDRGGYVFHGRVKALADGAREAGLKF